MAKDEEGEFRLRPRKPPARNERIAWASAYKIIMHHARTTSMRLRPSAGQGSGPSRIRPYSQRCAVRVIYAKNATSGQWRAHGRYVAREDGRPRNHFGAQVREGTPVRVSPAESRDLTSRRIARKRFVKALFKPRSTLVQKSMFNVLELPGHLRKHLTCRDDLVQLQQDVCDLQSARNPKRQAAMADLVGFAEPDVCLFIISL